MEEVRFFATPGEFREWLEEHHASETEILVGFYKKGSGRPSLTWSESVDQALCFGWIDGVRRGIDDASYSIRFTPRKPTSNWSAVNVAKVAALQKHGLMRPAGRAAFERRRPEKTAIYSYEQRRAAAFDPAQQAQLEANAAAWAHFSSRPPWYRRQATHWVTSAKREETRQRRLERLIEDSAAGRAVGPLRRPGETES